MNIFGNPLEKNSGSGIRGPPGIPGMGFELTGDGNYDLNNKKLVNVKDPVDAQDAVNKRYVRSLVKDVATKSILAESLEKYTPLSKFNTGLAELVIKHPKKSYLSIYLPLSNYYINAETNRYTFKILTSPHLYYYIVPVKGVVTRCNIMPHHDKCYIMVNNKNFVTPPFNVNVDEGISFTCKDQSLPSVVNLYVDMIIEYD